jgi:uncharacterized protein
MKESRETLSFKFEIKTLAKREFEGYGSTFGNVDLGRDIVVRGAFKQTLAEHKKNGTTPLMFWMHQPDEVPGKWLEMEEDDNGLYVKGILADTDLGNELQTLLSMKAVRGLSIGYSLSGRRDPDGRRTDVDYDEQGNRLLKELKLWEVSIVSLAMNPLARVEASKSRLSIHGEYVPTVREVEQSLHHQWGWSKTVARNVVSRIFDDDPGGMPDDHRRDAGAIDQDADELLKFLETSTASFMRESLR